MLLILLLSCNKDISNDIVLSESFSINIYDKEIDVNRILLDNNFRFIVQISVEKNSIDELFQFSQEIADYIFLSGYFYSATIHIPMDSRTGLLNNVELIFYDNIGNEKRVIYDIDDLLERNNAEPLLDLLNSNRNKLRLLAIMENTLNSGNSDALFGILTYHGNFAYTRNEVKTAYGDMMENIVFLNGHEFIHYTFIGTDNGKKIYELLYKIEVQSEVCDDEFGLLSITIMGNEQNYEILGVKLFHYLLL